MVGRGSEERLYRFHGHGRTFGYIGTTSTLHALDCRRKLIIMKPRPEGIRTWYIILVRDRQVCGPSSKTQFSVLEV